MNIETTGYQGKFVCALTKVFLTEEPESDSECLKWTGLHGETVSIQFAFQSMQPFKEILQLQVQSPLKQYICVRSVEVVPVGRACNAMSDENYLSKTPGLYPDLLAEIKNDEVQAYTNQWRSLWVDVELTEAVAAGVYPIGIQLLKKGVIVCSATTNLTVYDAMLPRQSLIHTEWFHADCLADYYHVACLSEAHWEIIENFIAHYSKRGMNMILTPIFTPPLDTEKGKERTTIQLVDVVVTDGRYQFSFDNLKRWVRLCQKYEICYFEMVHLFTQWGAKYAPKIIATVDGEEKQIFGWHTASTGAYTVFLEQFLPALIEKLYEWGIDQHTFFHLSDEPREKHLEFYGKAQESVAHLLKNFQTIDALSSYTFYQLGYIDTPIPASDQIHKFLEKGMTDMWVYYCMMQCVDVSNRFMAMPSARNRIFGVQLYKYQIKGFLHWGYNFYNSNFSRKHINPYAVTDADFAFPSGDAFLVYPGCDGYPEESIRMMVLYEAMTDLRALQYLESLTSRRFVMDLIEGQLSEPITFSVYPQSDAYLITLRNRVNHAIAEHAVIS